MAFFFIDSNFLNIAPKSVPNELEMQPNKTKLLLKLIRLEKIRLNLERLRRNLGKFD